VTVLMSVHNDRLYLPDAVNSVLRQTLDDFELLVIDDASTDGSGEFLRTLTDPRVRLVRNEQNLGLTKSLNRGLSLATGRYVARMDADDVCMPDRLRRQAALLDARPEVGIVGCSRVLIDEAGATVARAPAAETDLRIRWKCLLGNPFAHPAVMFRLDLIDTHRLRYDERFRTAQDYDLWSRLLTITRGHNLSEALLRYRLRNGVSRLHRTEQLRNHDTIAHASIHRLLPGFDATVGEVRELRGRFGGHSVREPNMDPRSARWVHKYLALLDAFIAEHGAEQGAAMLRADVRASLLRAA
jgi:glycosyltransferase involved in cell wall biosynthesis